MKKFEEWVREFHPLVAADYDEYASLHVTTKIPFNVFWNEYNKKTGKKKTESKWNRMSATDQAKALQVAIEYVKVTPNRQYRLNPLTYLNGEHYNDEELITTAAERLGNKGNDAAERNRKAWEELLYR